MDRDVQQGATPYPRCQGSPRDCPGRLAAALDALASGRKGARRAHVARHISEHYGSPVQSLRDPPFGKGTSGHVLGNPWHSPLNHSQCHIGLASQGLATSRIEIALGGWGNGGYCLACMQKPCWPNQARAPLSPGPNRLRDAHVPRKIQVAHAKIPAASATYRVLINQGGRNN